MTPSPTPQGSRYVRVEHPHNHHFVEVTMTATGVPGEIKRMQCAFCGLAPLVQEEAKTELQKAFDEQPQFHDAPTPTIELDELIGNCIPHLNEEGGSCAIYKGKPCNCGIDELKAALQSHIADQVREAIQKFEPFFTGDHSKCPNPMTCIGYENARSDFDNEKAILLESLKGDTKK